MKNKIKYTIKYVARTLWITMIKPVVNSLPDGRLKNKIFAFVEKIKKFMKIGTGVLYVKSELDPVLLAELKALGHIEPALQPSKHFVEQLSHNSYRPYPNLENNSYGEKYALIMRHLENLNFDVVFLAPWLKRGGADLGLLHHINAQHEKGKKMLLITTELAESNWINRLPHSVTHLDFAKFSDKLNSYKSIEMLARLLLQIPAQTIHNINSASGWEVFKQYGLQLNSMNKSLFASVFCEDEYEPEIYIGYAHYLPETFRYLNKVFCDTQWYPKEQSRLTGLDQLLKTVYFPFLGRLHSYVATDAKKSPVLWASRIAKQKRPELLFQIAKAMPDQEFHIYGVVESICSTELEELMALKNVKYFGKYDSFVQIIEQEKYAAFLYTSQYDGLPNVLIEAISNGLPVISYDVGGIGELIHKDVLLSDEESFEISLGRIKQILADKELLHRSWQYSQDILRKRHSWDRFINVLEEVDGYFPKLSQEEYQRCYSNFRVLSSPKN